MGDDAIFTVTSLSFYVREYQNATIIETDVTFEYINGDGKNTIDVEFISKHPVNFQLQGKYNVTFTKVDE